MRCAIYYHLCNFKNVKKTHGGVLLLVKLQAKSPWVFFTFLNCKNGTKSPKHHTFKNNARVNAHPDKVYNGKTGVKLC